MTNSPNLNLPYLLAAQSQKHVTHNEALRLLDTFVQLTVASRAIVTPPATPAEGDRYIVPASATGVWAGQGTKIAVYQDAAWMFFPPKEGWLTWIADENLALAYDGATWVGFSGGGGGVTAHSALTGLGNDDHLQYHTNARGDARYTPINPATLGVNATADATNKFAVGSAASLFNHTGTGGHQIKVNKAAVTDTASFLFQDNFSGRAEIGLTGDDDFHFKVSPNGTTFSEAIVINKTTGACTFPNTTLGGGSGTVTNVATGTGLTGGPITAAGTISLANMAANTIKGNNTGASAAPTDLTTVPTACMPAHSGDVTSTAGSVALTIAPNAVTNAKAAQMAAGTVKANTTGAAANATDATPSAVLDVIGSTRGSMLYRGAAGWAQLAPGTAGQVIQSNGAGADPSYVTLAGGGNALTTNPLSQFAATTSAQLAGVMSDETGTGALVFATNPALVTPNLGTPSAGTLTNCTGLPATALTGTLAAAQEPAHTGDVTNTAGSLALTIAPNAVTNAKAAQAPANTIKGNNTGAAANPADLTAAQVAAMLPAFAGSGASAAKGMVPAPSTTAGTTNFLREDGTWSAPAGGGGGNALTTNPLSQFAATTSAQLAGVITDETGTGALVFGTSPTLVTPNLGTPTSGILKNCTELPLYAGAELASTGSTSTTEGNNLVYRPVSSDITQDHGPLATGVVLPFPAQTWLIVSYFGATPGFSQAGYLTEFSVGAGANIPSGAILQAWVGRPSTTPPANTTGSFQISLVAKLGQWGLPTTASAPKMVFKGLMARVNAGDLLVLRVPAGTGWGFPYGSTGAYATDSYIYKGTSADTSMNALSAPVTMTDSGGNRLFIHSVRISDGPSMANTDGPNAVVRLNSTGFLPDVIGTAAALPLKGKKIAITGSSISTATGGGNSTDTGHITTAMQRLGCIPTNLAFGGAYALWNPAASTSDTFENQTIGATAAELTARFGASFAQYSYENKLVGQGYDGVIMPDCINDTIGYGFTAGVWGDTVPNTYYGCMTRMINALLTSNPSMLIWLQTPFHRWASYTTPGTVPTELANRELFRAAAYDIVEKMGLAGVIDYIGNVQCNSKTVQNGTALFDSIHPTQIMKTRAADVVFRAMNNIASNTANSAAAGAGGGGNALTSNPLSQFAATTSAQLAGVISDETGTGALMFNAGPSFAAGTTAVPSFKQTAGTLLTTAAAGAEEFDGTCFYATAAASSRQVVDTVQFITLTAAYTLTSQTAAQKLFNSTANGAVTVQAATTYFFECVFSLTAMSATSGSFGFAFGGTATLTSQAWWSTAIKAALATAGTGQVTYNTAANVTLVTANTTATGHARITGKIRVNAAGTLIPSVSLGVAAAAIVGTDSYFRIWPAGSGTVTNMGNWS